MSNKTDTLAPEPTKVDIEVGKSPKVHKTEVGRFTGFFAPYALGLYNILIACKDFDKKLAHLIATDYLNDWARGADFSASLKSKVSKAKESDNTCKMKGAGMEAAAQLRSNSMLIARVVQQIDELHKEKAIVQRHFPADECFPSMVREYLQEKREKVNATVWAD